MTVSLMPSTSLTEGMADIESFDGMFTPQSGGPDDTIEKETSIDNANGVKGGTMDKEKGWMRRIGDTLAKRGIEDRGVVPCPEDVGDVRSTTYNERQALSAWGYLPQFTIWAAWNTNVLTFSEGMLGPSLFELDLRTSILCIVFFTALSCIPPAYCATNGSRTGMRQMVQARYALGYYPALICGFLNCLQFIGFMSLTVILGGQSLSLASSSSLSWTVGIIVVSIVSLLLSFIGLRALHILSLASFPSILVLFIVVAGVNGSNLHLVNAPAAKAVAEVTASGVLGFGSSLIGFTVSYCSLASDFTTRLPPFTLRWTLFTVIFLGLFIPITLVQIFGAVAQSAAFAIPTWKDAALIGAPDLLFALTGSGPVARFVMVLMCFGVAANTAPTIYSCGLSGQIALPFLTRVPRYLLTFVVSAVFLPIAIIGANHFYTALSNFLVILAYWTAIYIPPVIIEPLVFRRPVSRSTYPVEAWNEPKKLPVGYAAMASTVCGMPLIVAGMSQTWWNGWIARKIPGGYGDVAWEITFVAVALIFTATRYLERRYTGR